MWLGFTPMFAWILFIFPVICSGLIGTASAWDQEYFHRPVIHILSAGLPTPSFIDYGSATTPGYHLFLAVIDRLGADDFSIRIVSSLFALGAAVVLSRVVTRVSTPELGAVSSLLFLLNPHVLGSAVHLTTDGFALLLLILTLAASLDVAREGVKFPFAARAVLWSSATAMVRQVLLWSAGVPFLAVLMRIAAGQERHKLRALVVTGLLNIPAVMLVGMFVLLWGGLVPPGFRVIHDSGLNPAAPIYALALVGCWGALIAAVHPNFFHALRSRSAIIGALLGFATVLLVKSSYAGPHDGVRWGGALWTIARYTPVIADRSIVIVTLATAGGAVLGAILKLAQGHPRRAECWTMLLALALGSTAQILNSKCFERYILPIVLIVIPLAVGVLLPTHDEVQSNHSAPQRARIAFPLLAVFLFLAVSTTDFYLKLSRENPPPPLPHEFRPTAPPR